MRGARPVETERARSLRQSATDTERELWYRLRSRQILGSKFVRQESIGPYIIDFICREQRLIVEVDGSQHVESKMRFAISGSPSIAIAFCDSGTTMC
jgi:very-short-patch-repair endonuclease